MKIEGKTKELLGKLSALVSSQHMSAEMFPNQDVMVMIKAFYQEEKQKRDRACATGIVYLEKILSRAVVEQNEEELAEVLSVLTDVEIEQWEKYFLPRYVVSEYKKKAKEMYSRYARTTFGENRFVGKGVIYTVITGNYDALRDPEYIDKNYKYICFTDNVELKSSVWEIRLIQNPEGLDPARLSRIYKILCYKYLEEYDYSIYVDGKIQICGDINEYIGRYSKGCSMLCFPHFVRDCAYEEAKACIQLGKDAEELITKQMEGYLLEGYPAKNGLIDAACMVRMHKDRKLQNMLEDWWKEVKNKSRRDQLSFGYACWKNGFEYDISDLFIYDNPYICKRRTWEAPF